MSAPGRCVQAKGSRDLGDLIEAMSIPEPNTGCWLWLGRTMGKGYGVLPGKLNALAHRVSWELANRRPIPKRMCVCHRCDLPGCVNPEHLFLGTYCDNVHDMIRKGRGPVGVNHLTWHEVQEIRASKEQHRALGRLYGVSESAIRKVRSGRAWRSAPKLSHAMAVR